MTTSKNVERFTFPPDHALAKEHAAVAAWIDEAVRGLSASQCEQLADLKSSPAGKTLLAGNPEQSRLFVKAALEQLLFWDDLAEKAREADPDEMRRRAPIHIHKWCEHTVHRTQAQAVVAALLRRALPLQRDDLLALVNWCCRFKHFDSRFRLIPPVASIIKALERFLSEHSLDPELAAALTQLAARLRSSRNKPAQKLASAVEPLLTAAPAKVEASRPARDKTSFQSAPHPAPAGSPAVMDPLKRALGMLPNERVASTEIGLDVFPLRDDSPLKVEHAILSPLYVDKWQNRQAAPGKDWKDLKDGRRLFALPPAELGRVVLAAAERDVNALLGPTDQMAFWFWYRYEAGNLISTLLTCTFEVDRDGLFDLLCYLSIVAPSSRRDADETIARLVASATQRAAEAPLSEGERFVLALFRASMILSPPLGKHSDLVNCLSALINDGATFYLVPGEAWTDAVNSDLAERDDAERARWLELLSHAMTATSARPSAKWLRTAEKLIQAIGGDRVGGAFARWFPLVVQGNSVRKFREWAGDTRGGGDTMNDDNADCLRGLLWCAALVPEPDELARAIGFVGLSGYKKVPGVGPRAVKVGNAAVYALSAIASKEAVGQLAILKVHVKFGTAQKEIGKAFDAAASALNLPRDQVEELSVPIYGLEEVGRRTEELGSYKAELVVSGSDAELNWFDAAGKPLKSVPAKVKSEFKDDLKDLQQSLKDVQAMLPAQRDRIDRLFFSQKRWPFAEWRERYLDHPLVGTIARRLIWCVEDTAVAASDGKLADVAGQPVGACDEAQVSLWHPISRPVEEIVSWRRRLETLGISQPFKQAHREVYLLTDAERTTATYSNRFAAHVIRQHQFNALCGARGWKNRLRLMVDDNCPPPSKELPEWNLRAEFWVESIGDHPGIDTNDSGVFLRLATDQVRFYQLAAAENFAHASGGGYRSKAAGPGAADINEPLPLDQLPPLVFSEIMRDVDMFVGVASVGNDPTWQDGGPGGRFREYWRSYAFGELSGTAATRKQTLERLIPRLKIADRCSFSDRFLIVRGNKRTYKIHLGSGNILMEPNDQYLCIVPDARARSSDGDLFLPFDGDILLSIIISKALLLADESKIKDKTITRQIDTR